MAAADALIVLISLWLALSLRLGTLWPPVLSEQWWLPMTLLLLSLPAFHFAGMYRSVVRFMGAPALIAVLRGAALSLLAFVALGAWLGAASIPATAYIIYGFVVSSFIVAARMFAWLVLPRPGVSKGEGEAALIYGAGLAGIQLAGLLEHSSSYEVAGFVDDDAGRQGTEIRGRTVFAPEQLLQVIRERDVRHVLLALPSASRQRRRTIITSLESANVRLRTVPGLVDIVSGAAGVDELRDVDIDDLLEREPVPPDLELLDRCIRGRAVLVTGAGGSIGSELCRQILSRGPTRLILFDQSEYALYRTERDLLAQARVEGVATEIEPILGNVLDFQRLQHILQERRIDTVYHAAAYKHVPLVEANISVGVANNVFGTLAVTRAAMAAGVGYFVLISTDKAVRPSSIMGASKRVAELIVQSGIGRVDHAMHLSMVRFGNVLDSSGSVVPLFREQIRKGGPVTVTHPEMTRYLMTIPEAAQLVLQAGAMGTDGDVFVLDMGEPVRILDLARRMIHLSGLSVRDDAHAHPDGDIAIEFIGMRPGEKLYEELLIGANVVPTPHRMIMRAKEQCLDWTMLERRLERLREFCQLNDGAAIRTELAGMVEGYRPDEPAAGSDQVVPNPVTVASGA